MNHVNSKNQKIQILRAFAIISVVIIHSYPLTQAGIYIRSFVNFAVSLFFFLSGYLTKLKNNNWSIFIRKRVIRVIIPYFIWSILWIIYSKDYEHSFLNILTGKTLYSCYFVFVYIQHGWYDSLKKPRSYIHHPLNHGQYQLGNPAI